MKFLGQMPNDNKMIFTQFHKKHLRIDGVIKKKLTLISDNPPPLDRLYNNTPLVKRLLVMYM